MSINGISNSAATATNLAALANTQAQLQKALHALTTGKAVNSASDNAVAFNTAQNLLQQASDLSNLKDTFSTALTTVNTTTDSIGSLSQVVKQLQGITAQAASTTDPNVRAGLASQFNALLPQLDNLAKDSNFNGTNLLTGASNSLTVNFNTTGTSSLTIQGVDATSSGLGISGASNGFATTADINAANTQLSSALSTLGTAAASFGGNATLIQTNQDFTSNLINSLQGTADNLTNADINQEAANVLALQAQNQLGVVSLGISGQLNQSILKIF